MNLRDYIWFNNPRGLRNKGPYAPFDTRRYLRPQMGWARLEAGGDEYVDAAAVLVEGKCMPIMRIHRSHMGAMFAPDDWQATYAAYIDVGCRWFELYDATNLSDAWPLDPEGEPRVDVTWENVEECIAPLSASWIDWAERIIELGGYPAFPAFAPSGELAEATVYWMDVLLEEIVSRYRDRFAAVVEGGMWCATRPATSNLYYQEPPAGPGHVARPYYQQRADEPGWHFEYPYDPILQRHDPGRTVFGGTDRAPYGDPAGLIAGGEAFYHLLRLHTGAGPIPVVATAGGIAPIPRPGAAPLQPNELYPPYDRESQAEATLAMFEWIARYGPPWFFGITLADEAIYYDGPDGIAPAIAFLAETPPLGKEVPFIEVIGVTRAQPTQMVEGTATATPVDLPDVEWLDAVDLNAPAPQTVTDTGPLGWTVDGGDDLWERFISEYEVSMGEAVDDESLVVEPAGDFEDIEVFEGEEGTGEPEAAGEDIPAEEIEAPVDEGVLPGYATEGDLEPGGLPSDLDLEAIEPEGEVGDLPEYGDEWPEEGLPEVETEPDYVDVSGQMVDAHEDDEAIPPLGLDDLPPDMTEEPEELAEDVELPTEEAITPGSPADEIPRTEVETQETLLYGAEVAVPLRQPETTGGADHWVIIAGGVDAEWFFEAGHRYWGRFRPTVATGWDALAHIPRDRQVAVTLVAPADALDEIEAQVRDAHAAVEIDPIACESEVDLETELNWRASSGKRLG